MFLTVVGVPVGRNGQKSLDFRVWSKAYDGLRRECFNKGGAVFSSKNPIKKVNRGEIKMFEIKECKDKILGGAKKGTLSFTSEKNGKAMNVNENALKGMLQSGHFVEPTAPEPIADAAFHICLQVRDGRGDVYFEQHVDQVPPDQTQGEGIYADCVERHEYYLGDPSSEFHDNVVDFFIWT